MITKTALITSCLSAFTILSAQVANATRQMVLDGASPMQEYAKQVAAEFGQANKIGVSARNNGSKNGLKCLMEKACDISFHQGDLTPEALNAVKVDKLSIDGIALVVSNNVNVNELTHEQVVGIFSGKITNWKEISGQDMPIELWQRRKASGIYDMFTKTYKVESTAKEIGTYTELQNRTKLGKGLVTYVGLSELFTGKVSESKAIKYSGVEPTLETVRSGKYPLRQYVYMVTRKDSAEDKDVQKLNKLLLDRRADLFPKIGLLEP